MTEYNFLKHNESDFPHVGNVDVYKYDNGFDYGRFDAPQMELQICSVPWDMGEAHIGNRTISGIGNVVYFGTKAKRDAWFDAIPDDKCYRFTTKFKELHRSLEIDVPIPYDMCAKHNYLRVKYNKLANDNSPIEYEGNDGLREWFWFIREVEFLAPSTTRLHLLDDAFQTWIYDVNVSGMVLERGHAPMFAMKAPYYLKHPVSRNGYLLTEDVNFGEASQVRNVDSLVFNDGEMYACIATSANPLGSWGSKSGDDWKVPASAYYNTQGQPSVYVFAVQASNLNTFLSNVNSNCPQFKQTIQGVFFASEKLITVGTSFTFASTTCYSVSAVRHTLELTRLTVDDFGYGSKYMNIAKLYTSPYAHIEVTDENGNVDIVKIEETEGYLQVSAMLSLAYPFITVDAHLLGSGGSVFNQVTYKNVSSHSFRMAGDWYNTLRSWNVPTFAVVLDAATEYDYSTHFERAQAVVDYSTTQTNVNASADTMVANADLTIAANSATVARSNTSANDSLGYTQTYNSGMATANNMIISGTATSTIAANEQQGAISAASGAASAAVGTLAAAATGNVAGAVSTAANGIIGSVSTLASTAVSNNLTAANAFYAEASNTASATAANTKSSWDTSNQTSTASDLADIQNDLTDGTNANSAATQKANAARSANAAQSAIDNGIAQAALNEPYLFGTFANGEGSTTKPMGLFAHIVTQTDSAISRAGDEFLRYGYAYDGQWEFDGNWNVGKYFTYWKLRDFWVSNLNVPDMYMDKLRFFLFGGVTVWRSPEHIGNVTVYDNFD